MNALFSWVAAHQPLAIVLLGVVLNLVTEVAKAHEKTSKFWLLVDSFCSRILPADLGGFIRDLVAMFGGSSSGGTGSVLKAREVTPARGLGRPPSVLDEDMTPTKTSPRLMGRLGVALMAGVALAAACLPAQDALRFGAKDVACVYDKTDHGEPVAQAVLECTGQNAPDAIKFFADLVSQRAMAKRAAACEPAPAPDAGAK